MRCVISLVYRNSTEKRIMKKAFANELISIRKRRGFKSALKFHEFLHQSGGIELNYAQYKKIESGINLARPDFVSRLARALPTFGEELIRAYCSDLFPDHSEIFASQVNTTFSSPQIDQPLLHAQDELNTRQISLIVTSADHYELYLILALARKAVSFEELKNSLPYLSVEILNEFEKVKLLYVDDQKNYSTSSREWIFPDASNELLKNAYKQMSEWDLQFQKKHHFNNLYTKILLRRVSLRYLPLLKRQTELLTDFLKASDEVDTSKNSRVVSLVIQLREGILPG